jgi:hypothetical protein
VPAILSDPVSDLVAAVGKVRVDDRLITDPWMQVGDADALLDTIIELQSVLVRRLRELDAADVTTELFGRGTRRWLTEEARLAGSEAGRYMRLLRHLPSYPATQAAFDAAEINAGHVAAILTALQSLPGVLRDTVEPHLIERARMFPPEEISGYVDELLEALGLDRAGDVRRERRLTERGVDIARTLDGTRSIGGTLTPEVGDALERALAQAGAAGGPEDDRTLRQRQHDALGVIANHYLGHNGTPSFTGAPRTMIVTIDLETLENQLRERWISLPDGATLSAATVRQLACDAAIIPAVLGSNSEILDIGQANQEFTTAQRRAAYLRDGGKCAFPSCRGKVAELHHIHWRSRGGPATLDNAAWLCDYHHWFVHNEPWTLRRDPVDKSYIWTGPYGQQRVRRLETA